MELYRKVRLPRADGMSKRAAAAHFNISRELWRRPWRSRCRLAIGEQRRSSGQSWTGLPRSSARDSMATRRRIASSGSPPSASSTGFVMSMGSPAATRSSRTTSGSASGADRRCSCRWRILRGMHRRISARRSFSSLAILLEPMAHDGSPSNIGPISSSSTCRRATPASYGPTPQRRRRPGWIVLCPLETGPFETGVFR